MIFGYIRISKNEQFLDSQKSLIARYAVEKKIIIDEFIEVEMSSKKSMKNRKIYDLLEKISVGDTIIVSELSRLARSTKEVFDIIEQLIQVKKAKLIVVKQNLDIDPTNVNDLTNKILLTVFSMVAELERDFISERTKEGLRARKEKGIKLGKPKGTIQKSMYDKDIDKIKELVSLGLSLNKIIINHLKYGDYQSLRKFVKKKITI